MLVLISNLQGPEPPACREARVMRVLAALGFVVETGREIYAPSRLTETFTDRTLMEVIRWMLVPSVVQFSNAFVYIAILECYSDCIRFDHSVKSIPSTPEFLRANGFKTPNDQTNGASSWPSKRNFNVSTGRFLGRTVWRTSTYP